ncbi:MAG: amidohydrolase [Acidimicrobiia bacterium]|nr:amidohydrolase [Acidimicrobiia bacterium]
MDRLLTARAVRTAAGVIGNSVLVVAGKVAAVGDRSELMGAAPEIVYQDGIIVPGLRDAHIHPVAYAAALRGTTLATASNFAEIVARLEKDAGTLPSGTAVTGMRLNEETLDERRLPTREVLDRGFPDRPALVHRYCGHVAIANSAALRLAGIDAGTPDPTGGVIDRDSDGVPTGVLRETGIELVAERLGGGNQISPQDLLDALERLAAIGITSIGAILRTGSGAWASLGNEVEIAVAAADRMPLKVGAYVIEDAPDTVAATKALVDAAPARLRWLGIKRFGDGSFGGHTAAMHHDYVDVATSGTMRLADIDRVITEASLALGGGAAIHAIGDSACGAVIDMFEDLIADGADPGKLRIEHASVLTRADMDRLAATRAIAVVQPPFLGSEAEWLGNRLGRERLQRTYAFATLDAAGVTLAGSSDSPVEPPDPWAGMALARDRSGMVPAESLEAHRALAMYTTGAALALGEPVPLAIGSPADLVVADRDPVAATPDELRATQVIATYVDGMKAEVDPAKPLWLD